MSAKIDGVQWNATIIQTVTTSISFGASGIDTPTPPFRLLTFAVPPTPGTYSLGGVANSQGQNAGFQNGTGGGWTAGLNSGSGTITLKTITATSATGTFSLSLTALSTTGATAPKVVTDGVFNLTF
jgi:hypothetical protein